MRLFSVVVVFSWESSLVTQCSLFVYFPLLSFFLFCFQPCVVIVVVWLCRVFIFVFVIFFSTSTESDGDKSTNKQTQHRTNKVVVVLI